MKRSALAAAVVVATAMSLGTGVHAQQSPPASGASALEVLADGVTLKAKIVSVDQAKRLLTVEGPNGPVVVHVADKIAGFEKVKAGDSVIVRFAEVLDVGVKKGDGIAESISGSGTGMSRPGQMPAESMVRYLDTTFVVQAVDAKNRTVRVLAPNGKISTLKVGPQIKNLDKLKAGDDIVVNFGEAASVQTVR
jgi:hypothetical protein